MNDIFERYYSVYNQFQETIDTKESRLDEVEGILEHVYNEEIIEEKETLIIELSQLRDAMSRHATIDQLEERIGTSELVADCLTKALPKAAMMKHRDKIMNGLL